MSRRNGFTLAELLVALALFGLIAGASVAMLAMGVNTRETMQARLGDQAALLRTRALLGADLGQATPRRTRDEAGRPVPAFTSAPAQGLLFGLVRAGWSNPDAAPRASLQRIEYRLVGDALHRQAAAHLDGAPLGPPAVLLQGLTAAALRIHVDGAWHDRWPPLGRAEAPEALPDAVELTLDSPATGRLRQVFLLPPDSLP
ncbi:MAG: type II secretion system minor pseudopilin GspJ [Polymorphobacter sp.]|uniref:type II secretion system minor pseudopilin GspJ n=1 Tax=Polymorphobacter sp. TaxID=1909290 RepID=UPI003A853049